MKLEPGSAFPDIDLPDHTRRVRRLSEIAGGDPLVALFSRGWWCPKEQRHLRVISAVIERYAGVAWPGGAFKPSLKHGAGPPLHPKSIRKDPRHAAPRDDPGVHRRPVRRSARPL